jgi:hypothetical protein
MTHKALLRQLQISCLGLDAVDPLRLLVDDVVEALTQPEQEPVAWMHPDGRLWTFGKGFDKSTFTIPLYTTPPQRTWVGLTDEEIAQGCKESWVTEQAWQSAVWWAEAKLKEKNT